MAYSKHEQLTNIRYEETILSGEGNCFVPLEVWTPTINPNNILYKTLFEPFNLEQYLYPRLPVDMGVFDIYNKFSVNVLRLPIKYPNSEYKIPKEIVSYQELIEKVSIYEMNINPNWNKTFCHITIDNSFVKANTHHRFPGWHGDGLQGAKFKQKIYPEHSYIITTAPATELCLQPFFIKHLDDAKYNMFTEFDKQAKQNNVYKTLPNHLYIFDPYIVHKTPEIKKDVDRTFVRITYTFSELEHPKNTVNKMFEPYKYSDRIDIKTTLSMVDFKIPYELYGIRK